MKTKKRFSLNFGPVFGQKKGLRSLFLCSSLLPKLQRRGATPQFCILFYANYTILETQRWGHGPMASPKYALGCNCSWSFSSFRATVAQTFIRQKLSSSKFHVRITFPMALLICPSITCVLTYHCHCYTKIFILFWEAESVHAIWCVFHTAQNKLSCLPLVTIKNKNQPIGVSVGEYTLWGSLMNNPELLLHSWTSLASAFKLDL